MNIHAKGVLPILIPVILIEVVEVSLNGMKMRNALPIICLSPGIYPKGNAKVLKICETAKYSLGFNTLHITYSYWQTSSTTILSIGELTVHCSEV